MYRIRKKCRICGNVYSIEDNNCPKCYVLPGSKIYNTLVALRDFTKETLEYLKEAKNSYESFEGRRKNES